MAWMYRWKWNWAYTRSTERQTIPIRVFIYIKQGERYSTSRLGGRHQKWLIDWHPLRAKGQRKKWSKSQKKNLTKHFEAVCHWGTHQTKHYCVRFVPVCRSAQPRSATRSSLQPLAVEERQASNPISFPPIKVSNIQYRILITCTTLWITHIHELRWWLFLSRQLASHYHRQLVSEHMSVSVCTRSLSPLNPCYMVLDCLLRLVAKCLPPAHYNAMRYTADPVSVTPRDREWTDHRRM